MDDRRLELSAIFKEILGNNNVYFQPPNNTRMSYPAIVYSRKRIENTFADNCVYNQRTGYEAIVIDPNPDSDIVYKMSQLPNCRHDRHYVSDNLNHDAFTLY